MTKIQKPRQIISATGKQVRWLFTIILFVYTSCTIFVLGFTVVDSLKTKSDLITNMFGLPKAINFDSYIQVLTEDRFLLYLKNSVILTVCGTFSCIFLSAMVAYGISRYDFKGKNALTSFFLIGMMFPIQVSILPLFIILKKLAVINTLRGMILIYAAGMSLPVYIFQKFFRTIPTSLEESARLDGAKEFTIFLKIIMPICKPVIFTVSLLTAIGQWNDFYMPMVFLGKKSTQTLTLAIYKYLNEFLRNMNVSFAAVVITLIPIIVLYCLFSKQIVEGLTGGAVKG
jgi:raffinose/stachyose/melibiose transport system permease protein